MGKTACIRFVSHSWVIVLFIVFVKTYWISKITELPDSKPTQQNRVWKKEKYFVSWRYIYKKGCSNLISFDSSSPVALSLMQWCFMFIFQKCHLNYLHTSLTGNNHRWKNHCNGYFSTSNYHELLVAIEVWRLDVGRTQI